MDKESQWTAENKKVAWGVSGVQFEFELLNVNI